MTKLSENSLDILKVGLVANDEWSARVDSAKSVHGYFFQPKLTIYLAGR